MPIYEYHCLDCGAKFDALRSFHEADEPIPCEKCNSFLTKRAISLCVSMSNGRVITSSNSGCSSCSGGSCSSCGH